MAQPGPSAKVFHVVEHLEGLDFPWGDGRVFKVEGVGVTGRRIRLVNLDDPQNVLRRAADEIVRKFVQAHSEEVEGASLRRPLPPLKNLAFSLAAAAQNFQKEIRAATAKRRHVKRRRLASNEGPEDDEAPACRVQPVQIVDGDGMQELAKMFSDAKGQQSKAHDDLARHELMRPFVFKSIRAVETFFKELSVYIPYRTLFAWVQGGGVKGPRGRRQVLDDRAERNIAKAVLRLDAAGGITTAATVRRLALSMLTSDELRAQFGADGPTQRWYAGWFKRMLQHFPDLCRVRIFDKSVGMLNWFTTLNINWWFDTVKRMAFKHRIARLPEGCELDELVWLDTARVVITDETCVSGGAYRTIGSAHRQAKTHTLRKRLDPESKKRAVPRRGGDYSSHITLLAGHNLRGEPTIPIWFFSASSHLQQATVDKVQKVAATGLSKTGCERPRMGTINGQEWDEFYYSVSQKGSVIQANIGITLTVFKRMFPDLADEDGKRVLWLTDWHSSRLDPDFRDNLLAAGIVLVGWLPMCTSTMQSPDRTIFAPFKAARDKIEGRLRQGGEKISIASKVQAASEALARVFTPPICLKGAALTGILPFNRRVLLANPIVIAADAFSAQKGTDTANRVVDTIHAPIQAASSSSQTAPLPPTPPPSSSSSGGVLRTPTPPRARSTPMDTPELSAWTSSRSPRDSSPVLIAEARQKAPLVNRVGILDEWATFLADDTTEDIPAKLDKVLADVKYDLATRKAAAETNESAIRQEIVQRIQARKAQWRADQARLEAEVARLDVSLEIELQAVEDKRKQAIMEANAVAAQDASRVKAKVFPAKRDLHQQMAGSTEACASDTATFQAEAAEFCKLMSREVGQLALARHNLEQAKTDGPSPGEVKTCIVTAARLVKDLRSASRDEFGRRQDAAITMPDFEEVPGTSTFQLRQEIAAAATRDKTAKRLSFEARLSRLNTSNGGKRHGVHPGQVIAATLSCQMNSPAAIAHTRKHLEEVAARATEAEKRKAARAAKERQAAEQDAAELPEELRAMHQQVENGKATIMRSRKLLDKMQRDAKRAGDTPKVAEIKAIKCHSGDSFRAAFATLVCREVASAEAVEK